MNDSKESLNGVTLEYHRAMIEQVKAGCDGKCALYECICEPSSEIRVVSMTSLRDVLIDHFDGNGVAAGNLMERISQYAFRTTEPVSVSLDNLLEGMKPENLHPETPMSMPTKEQPDDMTDFIGSKMVKKRKPTACIWCGETIAKGEKALAVTGADCGEIFNCYWHPECDAAYQEDVKKNNWHGEPFELYEFARGSSLCKHDYRIMQQQSK